MYFIWQSEVNRVCAEDALDGEVAYSDLITFQYDEEGTLIGLTTNMAELNALKATITSGIGNRLENLGQTQISVPLGTVSGVALFSGVVRIGKSWFIKMHLYKLIVCLLQEVMTKPNSM